MRTRLETSFCAGVSTSLPSVGETGWWAMERDWEEWTERFIEHCQRTLEDDDDDDAAVLAVLATPPSIDGGVTGVFREGRRGGSLPGKRPNVDRNDQEGAERIFRDYFSESPTYSAASFERRYRVPMCVFRRVHNAVVEADPYFKQRPDATGRMGKSSLQKMTAAIRMLAYGASADSLDEYCRLSSTVALESMKRFANAVYDVFGGEYLRSPTREDLTRIMKRMEKNGFPGCIGSIDCQHWQWKNCPTAYHGQYIGK